MSENGKMYFIHCLSPVHIGTGQGVGDIDMPIIRERTTEWPYIPGSTVKGVQRRLYNRLEAKTDENDITSAWVDAVFGRSEYKSGEEHAEETNEGIAGALVFTDSRMLAFPVASLHGVFAYVTCPLALRRFVRDSKAVHIGMDDPGIAQLEQKLGECPNTAIVCRTDSKLLSTGTKTAVEPAASGPIGDIWLDEFQFQAFAAEDTLTKWADWCAEQLFPDQGTDSDRASWNKRLVVVSDEAFHYFVTMCCEVTPRIRMQSETKVVKEGALWYEEYIPSEAILYGLVWCDNVYAPSMKLAPHDVLQKLRGDIALQIGANSSAGKGRVRYLLSGEAGVR